MAIVVLAALPTGCSALSGAPASHPTAAAGATSHGGPARRPVPRKPRRTPASLAAYAGPVSSAQASGYAGFHPVTGVNQDGDPELFAVESSGELVHDWWTGTGWSGWMGLATGSFLGSPAVLRNPSGTLEVYVVTAGGTLDHLWQHGPDAVGGWSGVNQIGSSTDLGGDPTALLWPDGHAEVFAVTTAGSVVHAWREPGGAWGGWAGLGGAVAGPVGVGTNQDGRPELFAVGSSGTLVHDWWTGGAWSGWFGLAGGAFAGSPGVLRNPAGTLEVFALTSAGAVDHVWQHAPNGAGGWSNAAQIGTLTDLAGDPSALLWPDGHAEVFAVTTSGVVAHAWRAPGGAWAGWASLGGTATGRLDIWLWPSGRPELDARFAGGAMSHAWWNGGAWVGWPSLGGDFRLGGLSLAQLAGQRVVYSYAGLDPPASLLQAIRQGEAAGVIFFGGNISSDAQIQGVIAELQRVNAESPLRAPLLMMTDQEGGLVRRLPGAPVLSEKQIGQSPDALSLAAQAGTGAGQNLRGVGMNVNLAPVLDVYRQAGDFDDQYQRSYSMSPQTVASLGTAFIKAQQATGVAATAKHFPGLGAATASQNTDLVPVTLNVSLTALRAIDELPYPPAIAAGVKLVMVSWAVYPALDPARPAGLSTTIVQGELRQRLGFQGVTITDDLGAGALQAYGAVANRGVLAAQAGMDLLLFAGQNIDEGTEGLGGLVGNLQDGQLDRGDFAGSVERVLALRSGLPG